MAIQGELARARDGYTRETEFRMKALTEELEALRLRKTRDLEPLRRQLQEQEEASHQAGFAGIAHLCQQMQVCLKNAQEGGATQLATVAGGLPGVCRPSGRMHTTLKEMPGAPSVDNVGDNGRDRARGDALPHAVFSTPNAVRIAVWCPWISAFSPLRQMDPYRTQKPRKGNCRGAS